MAKVLVVDDDPVIQRLMQVNLEMEGYEVALASDGDEAIAQAKALRPAVILLDVMMPLKDGWQVAAELKKDPEMAGIHIVFLSARAHDADMQRGADLGVAAYITKPFDPIDLMELVAELTQGQKA